MRAWVDRYASLLVLVTLLVVPGAVLVLYVGGSQPTMCMALSCPPPTPSPVPLIGTRDGVLTVLTALVVVWLGATIALLDLLWHRDRRRLKSLLLGVAVAAVFASVAGFGLGAANGHRLRTGAETALPSAAVTAFLVLWIGVAWAVATLGSRGRETG